MSELEIAFDALWARLGYPPIWTPEYRFAPPRRFRFDRAMPAVRVAVELDGGTWSRGRHVRGDGYERDCEKTNLASERGWRVFHLTRSMLENDPARWLEMIAEACALDEEVVGERD
jgi:very-short-patch-repair endonuclease